MWFQSPEWDLKAQRGSSELKTQSSQLPAQPETFKHPNALINAQSSGSVDCHSSVRRIPRPGSCAILNRYRQIKELSMFRSLFKSMFKSSHLLLAAALAICVVLPARSSAQSGGSAAGAVFVMTNAADKNEVIAFKRASDGSLEQGQSFPTGGRGSGGVTDPLSSQGSLTLSQDRSLLFAARGSP